MHLKKSQIKKNGLVCVRCGADVEDRVLQAIEEDRKSWRCACESEWVTVASNFIVDDAERERAFQHHRRRTQRVQSELRRKASFDAEAVLDAARAGGPTGRVLIEAIEKSVAEVGEPNRYHTDLYLSALVLHLAKEAER